MTIVRAVTVLNVVILAGLVAVWIRSYWTFRARHTLGLLTFGGVLLVQNVLAVYLYTFDPDFTAWMMKAEPTSMLGMAGLAFLQLAAFLFLGRVTWQ